MKLVPCECSIEIRIISDDIPNRLDASLNPIKPCPEKLDNIGIFEESYLL